MNPGRHSVLQSTFIAILALVEAWLALAYGNYAYLGLAATLLTVALLTYPRTGGE